MGRYFGVIGNRDYIKLRGERRPFWEFLDEQPAGWLTSLVYARRDLPPGKPMIWDCGAWSWRNQDEPTYSPQQCADLYREFAPAGSMTIAPDHMLIPGVDVARRRTINLRNAEAFLGVVDQAHTPMAAIHGTTVAERIETARELVAMGYRHLAVGGVAAQASQRKAAVEIVRSLRAATPGAHLHVLGLSSPEYARQWAELGVDTYDGSSHFKQAFTAGIFFTQEGARLTKHQAARPGESITAPLCHCRACALLRADGIDTRSYGSNETNMGRAAHNQNMLMRAQRAAVGRKVVLVACCGEKTRTPEPAQFLYRSELFRKARTYALQYGDDWRILSAKHGVVRPDEVVEPYDVTLSDLPAAERRAWSERVAQQLAPHASDTLIVLAGENYCGWTDRFPHVQRPMKGLAIGQQLSYLTTNAKNQLELF